MLNQVQRLRRAIPLSLRLKLTLPYVALALAVAMLGAFFSARLIFDTLEERFAYQLQTSGRLVADVIVEIEEEQLAALRAVSHTNGVAEAVQDGDAEALRRLILPLAVNHRVDLVEVLDMDGVALLSLHKTGTFVSDYEESRGAALYAEWPIVQRVLAGEVDRQGDKFAGLTDSPWGPSFYIAGPIHQRERQVGVALVGIRLDRLVQRLLIATGSYVTIYGSDGRMLASALPVENPEARAITPEQYAQVLENQDAVTPAQNFMVGETEYGEVLGPLEAREGEDLAVFSAALEPNIIVRASPITQVGLGLVVAALIFLIILVGTALARSITRHLLALVQASQRVAGGDLSPQVTVQTGDEVERLAASFNEMVARLREAQRTRDIFGRAVSPQVAEALLSKGLELGGETREVTVLFSDIRGFSTLSEYQTPQEIVAWINEYMTEMEIGIREWGGVITRFVGDAIVATFNAPEEQPDHPYRAIQAALAMGKRLNWLNQKRAQRGDTPIRHGIGVGTGKAVAGRIGSPERAEYTVIGDAVNVASRLQELTKEYPDYDILTTQSTIDSLPEADTLRITDLGAVRVKGREQAVRVYGVAPLSRSSSDGSE